jgi:5-methylcytosine-specific restriction enzyme subunit McrC
MPTRYEPPRRRESLREYESAILPEGELTERDLTVLQALGRTDLLAVRRLPGAWEISARAVVGVLTLDRVVLELQPKIMVTGEQVMAWICFALSRATRVEVFRRWSTTPRGLPDLIVAALTAECRVLLRDQLRRDYRRQDAVEPVLRGRLDIAKQLSRRFGQLDQLHVRTFDRDVAIWENLACHAALQRAARVAGSPELKHAARDVAAGFPACHADPRTVLRWLATARYHHMNSRYRPAHTWAALLLGGGGLSGLLVEGPWQAESLLINMNRLWEAVVRRLAGEAATALGGSPVPVSGDRAIVVHEQGRTTRSFPPDVLLRLRPEDPALLPVDAKYKRYDQDAVGNADIHQLLTYAHGYRRAGEVSRALIVHPAALGSSHRSITVRAPSGRPSVIDVVGLDVRQTPQQCVTELTEALTRTPVPR